MNTIKTRPFNMANHLGSEEEITEYLHQVLEDGDRLNWMRHLATLPAHGRTMAQSAALAKNNQIG